MTRLALATVLLAAACGIGPTPLPDGGFLLPDGGGVSADGGAIVLDAGFVPVSAWPNDATQVVATHFYSPLSLFSGCQLPDGGFVRQSTWSLDLVTGAVAFQACFARERLYVVDAGVLSSSQFDAFNAAARAMRTKEQVSPPCSGDSDVDRFVVTTSTGMVSMQDTSMDCSSGILLVSGGANVTTVLEAATHP